MRSSLATILVVASMAAGAAVLGTLSVEEEVRQESPQPEFVLALDQARQLDLDSIANALVAFRAGTVPLSTNGQIQTLCTFPEDAGCVVFPLAPRDPAGFDYYWRTSGVAVVVYAQRSANETIPCFEQPEHLAELGSVMCVKR